MSKTFEPLPATKQNAMAPPTRPAPGAKMAKRMLPGHLEAKLNAFYQTICATLPEHTSRSLQFISARRGEQASPLLQQFARHTAERIGKPVLLIDFKPEAARISQPASPSPNSKADMPPAGPVEEDLSIQRVENSMLFLAHVEQPDILMGLATDPRNWSELLQRLRQRFELILLDTPPLSEWPDGLSLVGAVDGVVLIVEAEATRWQVAQTAREEIQRHGGKLLGVILNKRRFYIPNFIYKWLWH